MKIFTLLSYKNKTHFRTLVIKGGNIDYQILQSQKNFDTTVSKCILISKVGREV